MPTLTRPHPPPAFISPIYLIILLPFFPHSEPYSTMMPSQSLLSFLAALSFGKMKVGFRCFGVLMPPLECFFHYEMALATGLRQPSIVDGAG